MNPQRRDWSVFLSSLFFVLGFSVVFSVVGVLLQTTLAHVSGEVQVWLGRAGGVVIILFGLFLLNLWTPKFLSRSHVFAVKSRFRSSWLTSFAFGAAFAVGWTPCVSAALGAILALAATQAAGAFLLLLSYTIGLGVPFLLAGFFVNQAQAFIIRAAKWLRWLQYFFGVLLVTMGILVFVGELSRIANIPFLTEILLSCRATLNIGGSIAGASFVNLAVAFLAGLGSFLSPCILPLIPGFLSYLATSALKSSDGNES